MRMESACPRADAACDTFSPYHSGGLLGCVDVWAVVVVADLEGDTVSGLDDGCTTGSRSDQ